MLLISYDFLALPIWIPLYYCVWDIEENNEQSHNTNNLFKAAVGDMIGNMNENYWVQTNCLTRGRIEAVFKA